MSTKQRFLEHLKAKGAIPESYACGGKVKGYAAGGMVEDEMMDDEEPEVEHEEEMTWPEYNYHFDTSGDPRSMRPEVFSHDEVEMRLAQALRMRKGGRK
jgi:hypothetical protein